MNTAEQVLTILRGMEKVSGEAIARRLKVSRTAIWKAINSLRDLGYAIEGNPKGYILAGTPDLLLPYEITGLLKTKVMGRRIEHHFTIGSTNERVKELVAEGWPEGSLVISEVQETGKGRIGRSWVSPKGGIWMSLLLKPGLRPRDAPILTLAGGVAVVEALGRHGFEARLKWPNDILIGERKVSGLLTEMSGEIERIDYIVMGFGLNANFTSKELPAEIRSRTTTLLEETGSPVDRKALVADVMGAFESNYHRPKEDIIDRWKALSATLGRRVKVVTQKDAIEGKAVDLEGSGGLLIRTDDGKETIVYSGDCQLLREG